MSQRISNRIRWVSVLAAGIAQLALAGAPPLPQIDVSISVAVTPSAFQPGDQGTVTLSLQNYGPEPAGVVQPGPFGELFANFVIGPGFALANASEWGPFDIVWESVSGCFATYDIVGPGPPPNFSFGLIFQFYFEVVQPNQTRTCTFDVVFRPRPFETFESRWRYVPSGAQLDTNPANNEVFYTFVAGTTYAAPTPVPASSWITLVGLGSGLLLLAFQRRRAED